MRRWLGALAALTFALAAAAQGRAAAVSGLSVPGAPSIGRVGVQAPSAGGGGGGGSSFTGLVGTRNLIADSSNNNKVVNSETGSFATAAIPAGSTVQIVIPSFRLDNSTPPSERGGAGAGGTVGCSLQYNDGGGQVSIGNCTFAGASTATLGDKSYIVSDPFVTTKTIPAGALYKTRIYFLSSNATCTSACFQDVGAAARVSSATYDVHPSHAASVAASVLAGLVEAQPAIFAVTRSSARTQAGVSLGLGLAEIILGAFLQRKA
jgi:hypothetical protein